eukprot:CAMPEP_0174716030 /NCGR_PEP_ID=MMETSP1094-20130205/22742_1 /TAXON_ID=156173 /ORGANISM="Chrysochromulina brevifilum, Strain UTEX LB 985" /LENGTH=286 /DNA_ID=CAMNT_0015915701 /DNA_START=165 /DNA_END=1025 /DNA_ORIENTATION=+
MDANSLWTRWDVQLPLLQINHEGAHVRPQLMLGVHFTNLLIRFGIGDLREKVTINFNGQLRQYFGSKGQNIHEVLQSLKAEGGALDMLFNLVIENLALILDKVFEMIHVDLENPDGEIDAVFIVKVGVGTGLAISIPLLRDREGYDMVGAGLMAMTAFHLAFGIFAGWKEDFTSARVYISFLNFEIRLTINKRTAAAAQAKASHGDSGTVTSEGEGVGPLRSTARIICEARDHTHTAMDRFEEQSSAKINEVAALTAAGVMDAAMVAVKPFHRFCGSRPVAPDKVQ